ncbi:phosphoribulokinase [Macrococcus animalis]|uniref:phosphoribulokinase n=1 Tax=Macrococcus animalis TaxID=3395467 RepID=UPI0039BE1DCD
MDEFINEIINIINQNDNTINIRISGHGASGKSTFAKKLIRVLEENTYNLLETDPYIIDSRIRKLATAQYEYKGELYNEKITGCMPLAHELNSLKRDILALSAGIDMITIDEPWAPSVILHGNKRINIYEGLSLYFLEKDLFDISINFKCDEKTELSRRLERDITIRGANSEYVLSSQAIRRRQYEYFMLPLESEFDYLINTSNNKFIMEKTK